MDIKEIKENLKKVLEYSQHVTDVNVDNIFNEWYNAKHHWIRRFGGELIYEYPENIAFELDIDTKQCLKDDFVEKIADYYCNDILADFVARASLDEFYQNITKQKYYNFGIEVPINYKFVKAFKFFETNIEKLKRIQNDASMIIQENIVSGKLCLSVHPLDYLSLSENAHNWRSCHALDGDYRSGNMNYMMDKETIICYLRAEKQAILPHFPEDVIWNSKKWRVLIFFSADEAMFFLGRQYPFNSLTGIELIREKLLRQVMPIVWSKYHQPVKLNTIQDTYSNEIFELFNNRYIPVESSLIPVSLLIQNGENTYHFNDLTQSTCYIPLYSYAFPFYAGDTGKTKIKTTKFSIGKQCRCIKCGIKYINFHSRMFCEDCDQKENSDDYFECDMCGSLVHVDNKHLLPYSQMRVCNHCYTHSTHRCESCGIRDTENFIHYRPEVSNALLCDYCTKDILNETDAQLKEFHFEEE